jgi:hypothetical protein
MKEVDSQHPAGTIGVPIGSLARYVGLFASLDRLQVPKGTELLFAEGVSVAHNCNTLVRAMKGEWLFIMGDDHRFRPEMLLRLLDHSLDVVAPVVSRRGLPFQTVMYKAAALDGSSYLTYSWADLTRDYPHGGVISVDAVGSAGLLVRKHVFGAVPDPWFEWTPRISEDINFCLKVRKAGYGINVDLDQCMTHITTCELEPYKSKTGEWNVSVNVGGRRVSITNTPHEGKDLREATYGHKDGLGGAEWHEKPELTAI